MNWICKFLVFLFLTISTCALAQPPVGGCVPDGVEDCTETDEDIPLDKHVIQLIGGGIIIGIIYLRRVDRGELKS